MGHCVYPKLQGNTWYQNLGYPCNKLTPKPVLHTFYHQHNFIEVPLISRTWPSFAYLRSNLRTKSCDPIPDRFVRNFNASWCKQILSIARTQRKARDRPKLRIRQQNVESESLSGSNNQTNLAWLNHKHEIRKKQPDKAIGDYGLGHVEVNFFTKWSDRKFWSCTNSITSSRCFKFGD